jgi:prepilin-type processing-associated H-X9-DG protein
MAPGTGCVVEHVSITDSRTNTILAVEALPERAVPWSKPEDLPFDPKDPTAGLVVGRSRQFNALFADGHVQTFSANIDPEVLRRLFLMNDGEPTTEAELMAAQGGR